MRSRRLYLATRSLRQGAPVLICPVRQATAKSAMVVSSVSPEWCWHPQVHALASRGGWDGAGRWVAVPFVDATVAARLFRHQVIALLREEGLLSPERIELLLSWRNSGFSAHHGVTVVAGDTGRASGYQSSAPMSEQTSPAPMSLAR